MKKLAITVAIVGLMGAAAPIVHAAPAVHAAHAAPQAAQKFEYNGTMADPHHPLGVCGPAAGVKTATEPKTDLCASGSFQAGLTKGPNPWTWACVAQHHTHPIKCTAPSQ